MSVLIIAKVIKGWGRLSPTQVPQTLSNCGLNLISLLNQSLLPYFLPSLCEGWFCLGVGVGVGGSTLATFSFQNTLPAICTYYHQVAVESQAAFGSQNTAEDFHPWETLKNGFLWASLVA